MMMLKLRLCLVTSFALASASMSTVAGTIGLADESPIATNYGYTYSAFRDELMGGDWGFASVSLEGASMFDVEFGTATTFSIDATYDYFDDIVAMLTNGENDVLTLEQGLGSSSFRTLVYDEQEFGSLVDHKLDRIELEIFTASVASVDARFQYTVGTRINLYGERLPVPEPGIVLLFTVGILMLYIRGASVQLPWIGCCWSSLSGSGDCGSLRSWLR